MCFFKKRKAIKEAERLAKEKAEQERLEKERLEKEAAEKEAAKKEAAAKKAAEKKKVATEEKATKKKAEKKEEVKPAEPEEEVIEVEEKEEAKTRKAVYRVVFDKEDGLWKIKKDGAKRVIGSRKTKEEALARVQELSANQDSKFVVYKKDGKFQKKANLKLKSTKQENK